jgi:ferritin-like metal-binding protein YciE
MLRVTTMEELFLDEIRDLYDAEKQLLEALPQMARAVASADLRSAVQEHVEQTGIQVKRLERIFEVMGERSTGKKCSAMAALIKEANEIAAAKGDPSVRDAGLIAAAQKVEHYEVSGYGSARAHAEILGDVRAARLLSETLFEEKEADERLTELAESIINGEEIYLPDDARPKTRGAGGSGRWD